MNSRDEFRRFVENKPQVSDEFLEALNIIERVTANALNQQRNSNKYQYILKIIFFFTY